MRSIHLALFAGIVMLSSCQIKKKAANTKSEIVNEVAENTHHAANSLDWSGTYKGVLPCADCQGIETTITLKQDETYEMTTIYQGKETKSCNSQGQFSWNEAKNSITLSGITSGSAQYFVGENTLTHLDIEGKKITGELANHYVLTKANETQDHVSKDLYGVKWELTELFGKAVSDSDSVMKHAFIVFKESEQRIHGSGSCNNFNGGFEAKPGNRIRLTGLATTMMACPDMETERSFFKALNDCDNYTIANGELSLNKARMAPMARFKAVPLEE